MTAPPLISIVVPSLNQGEFLAETLQSLVVQAYPNLEVIVQDGGSQDGSVAIAQDFARRFPGVFQVFVEPDRGQSHALNLGFAKAHGEILGFLNSDDTLYPGCLARVAREIDPARGRWIVFGRCLFTGAGIHAGVEHPAEFVSRFEQLAIWKRGFNTIPQPSVFWHRRVWETCGGLDEREAHVLDYDLFCRFSGRFHFYKVDELWSTYRLHESSKSSQRTEGEVLALSVAVSRRHWPGWWHPLRSRLAWSHWLHDRHAHERARHHARRAEQAFAEKHTLRALGEFGRTLVFSPAMAWHRLLQPLLVGRGLHLAQRVLFRPGGGETTGSFTGHYPDGWVGPLYRQSLEVPANAKSLRLRLKHSPQPDGHHREIHVELCFHGRTRKKAVVSQEGPFEMAINLVPFRRKTCWLELIIRPSFVPSAIYENSDDHRHLTALLLETVIEPADE